MAKRKSNNRRSSRYNRSSVGSGRLDPNSGVLGEEEPFWWNNLTNNITPNLEKYNITNETSQYLNSESRVDLSNVTHAWWKELDSSGHRTSKNLQTVENDKQSVIANPVPETTKMTVSDSDKESSSPTKRIKKIQIRGKLKRSKSNAFLKALNDSKDSESASSEQEVIVSNPTNDMPIGNKSLKVSDRTENRVGKKDGNNVTTSSDESSTTDKILKSRPKVFGKRYKETRENVFEDVLKSVEDTPDETEKSKMMGTSSLNKSIERNDSLDENIVDASKRHASQMQSSMRNSRQFIVNADKSRNDDNYIFRNRSDSSLEIQSDDKSSPIQQNSFSKKRKSSPIKSPDSSEKVNNPPANERTLRSSQIEIPTADNRSERSSRHVSRASVLNESKMSERSTHSEINRSKRSINVVSQENINEEDLINESNDGNIQETSENEKNLSYYKRRRINMKLHKSINDDINIEDPFRSNDRINSNIHDVTTDFANEDLSDVNEPTISGNQMNKVTSHDNVILTENDIEDISRNERETSVRSISTSSEDSFPNYNERTQPKEVDINASTLKQKSDKITDIVANDNDENLQQRDQLQEKITNSMNTSLQKNTDNDQNVQERDQLPDKSTNAMNTSLQKNIDNDQNSQESDQLHEKTTNSMNASLQKNIDNDQNSQESDQLHEKTTNSMNTSLQKNINNDQNLQEKDQLPDKTINSMNTSLQENIDNDQNLQERDQLPDKTTNSMNISKQKKIDGDRNLRDEDRLRNKAVNSISTGYKKKINDYFTATTSKLVSPVKTKQSKNIEFSKQMKEDEVIKARVEEKRKAIKKNKEISNKEIGMHLAKINARTQLSGNEIKEKIKRLQNKETKKPSKKDKIDKAYVVNGKVYKRPRLPRPQAWVTDRFYHHLWKIMEPKCKLLTRVKSEKFVEELSDVVTTVTKSKKYADYEKRLNDLMNQMANLGIIRTRNDFYIFCHEFLPYDFRIKVVPMIIPGNVRNIPYDPEKVNEPLLEE